MRGLAAFLLLCLLAVVCGHGYMKFPKTRQMIHDRYKSRLGGGDGSGVQGNVEKRILAAGADFPDLYPAEGTHGLCGDPWRNSGIDYMPAIKDQHNMIPTPYQVVYEEGQIIEIQVAILAHHRGYVEFRICDHILDTTLVSQAAGQWCLDQHLLQRVDPYDPARNGECGTVDNPVSPNVNPDCAPLDPNQPGRFWLPPNSLLVSEEGSWHAFWSMKYKLPEGLSCNASCTMQFWWHGANGCKPAGEREYYYDVLHAQFPETLSGGDHTWYTQTYQTDCSVDRHAQQFWNCADILILPSGNSTAPTLQPTPPPVDPVEDSEEQFNNGNCVSTYAKCGELGLSTCCAEWNDVCYYDNDNFYECRPIGDCPNGVCIIVEGDAANSSAYGPATPPATTQPAVPPSTTAESPEPPSTPPPEEPEDEVEAPPTAQIEGCFSEGHLGLYGNCTGQHSGCCGGGLLCYTVDDSFAQCRPPGSCPDCAWDCRVLAPPCPSIIGKHGNCRASHCCAEGLVCYEQDGAYAMCLEPDGCPACGWSCAPLLHGLHDQ